MIDISEIAANLHQRDDGVWIARHQSQVSYPQEGNAACFAIEDGSFWFRHRNQVIIQLIRTFSPTAVFFDIGGGNGFVSNALQSAGIDTVLLEPGPTGACNAKKRGLRTVIQSTLQDAGFALQSIPSAGLFDIIEHVEHDTDFMRLVCDCLQPHGTVYVTVPAFQLLWSNDDVHAGHFRRYTTRSLSSLLTQSGFDVKYCGYLFSFLVPPIFLFRSVPSWLGFRKSVSQSTTRREHTGGTRFVHSIVHKLLSSELNKINERKAIRFGSSCIAVAEKA